MLTAAVAHGYAAAMENMELKRKEEERKRRAAAIPPIYDSMGFRLGANTKKVFDLTGYPDTKAIVLQSASTGEAGRIYMKMSNNISVDNNVVTEGDWDWVGNIGGPSIKFEAFSQFDYFVVFVTGPCEGTLFFGNKKDALPV
jgi:hypothetical protein